MGVLRRIFSIMIGFLNFKNFSACNCSLDPEFYIGGIFMVVTQFENGSSRLYIRCIFWIRNGSARRRVPFIS